jgi:hypothetical protein
MVRVTDFRKVDLIVPAGTALPHEVAEYLRLCEERPAVGGSLFSIPRYLMDEWVQRYDMALPAPEEPTP